MGLPPGVLSKSNTSNVAMSAEQQSKETAFNIQKTGMGMSQAIIMPNISKDADCIATDPKGEVFKDSVFNAKPCEDTNTPAKWFLTMLLYSIPIVNIVYVVYLLFKCEDEQKRNWVKGAAVMLAVSYVINIIALIILKNISLAQLFDLYIQYKG